MVPPRQDALLRVSSYTPLQRSGGAMSGGRGVLTAETGETYPLDLSRFRPGGWKPTREEARREGDGVFEPRVGEVVRGSFEQQAQGWTLVSATRIAAPRRSFSLREWLHGFRSATGLLAGVTETALRDGGELACSRLVSGDETRSLLVAVHSAVESDYPFRRLRGWGWGGDWKDVEAFAGMGALLGINEAPRGGFDEQVARYNQIAAARGVAKRLWPVETDGDDPFVIAVTPEAYRRLVAEELLVEGTSSVPSPRGPSSFDEARAWERAGHPPHAWGHVPPAEVVRRAERVFREAGFDSQWVRETRVDAARGMYAAVFRSSDAERAFQLAPDGWGRPTFHAEDRADRWFAGLLDHYLDMEGISFPSYEALCRYLETEGSWSSYGEQPYWSCASDDGGEVDIYPTTALNKEVEIVFEIEIADAFEDLARFAELTDGHSPGSLVLSGKTLSARWTWPLALLTAARLRFAVEQLFLARSGLRDDLGLASEEEEDDDEDEDEEDEDEEDDDESDD